MFVRKVVYYWQFVAALVLPLWLFVGWGVWGSGVWSFLGVLVCAPVVFVAQLVVSLILYGRPEVRRDNSVSWRDAAMLLAWHASLVGLGFFGATTALFGLLGAVLGVAVFWTALWELISGTARRAREAMRTFEEQAARPQEPRIQQVRMPRVSVDGDVLVVHENPPQR